LRFFLTYGTVIAKSTMKIRFILLIILASLVLVSLVLVIIFHARPPVLIVTEQLFIDLYGEQRIRDETFRASIALYRPVKTVVIANDAGDDIISLAVSEISSNPFCVLFPIRFARSARLYQERNPNIPIILLEGHISRADANSLRGDFFIFKSDIESDFYRAGIAAAALDNDQNGRIIVFLEHDIMSQAREAFLKALNDLEKPLETRFLTSFSQFSETADISCIVLAGLGIEYLDKKSGVPVIFFTWLNPFLIPADIAVVVNDSPWVQVVKAVRMVRAGETRGTIPSNFFILDRNKFDRETLRKILKI